MFLFRIGDYLINRVKFIYSESKVEISQNFVAFSEYMNFINDAQGYYEIGWL